MTDWAERESFPPVLAQNEGQWSQPFYNADGTKMTNEQFEIEEAIAALAGDTSFCAYSPTGRKWWVSTSRINPKLRDDDDL